MAKKQINLVQQRVLRVARVHFSLVMVFALSIIVFDAWNLITPESVLQRWMIAMGLLIMTSLVWYASRDNIKNNAYYKSLVLGIVLMDIIMATFLVYIERGMASRSVLLYSIPIVTSGVLGSRRALFATAAISTAMYSFAAVRYFIVNFNEGYKIELYGTISFYSALFFVLAGLLLIVMLPNEYTD